MENYKPAPRGLVSFLGACCSVSMMLTPCFAELPDSPGSAQTQAQIASVQKGGAADTQAGVEIARADPQAGSTSTAPQSNAPSSNPQPAASQQQPVAQPGQKPVGTAAAESVPATGVAASQPAGTAIAPGKQRRTRSLVIKVGALVGAGVAIGTVAALSLGTSSKPPGAR